jgi:O-antigen ligase
MLLLAIFVQSAMTNYRFEVFSKKLEKVPTENTHTRFLIWHQATNVIEESFLFGHGTGDAQAVLNVKYLSKGYTEAYKNQLNAHNQYLETTISLGLIGLFVLCLLLIYPFLIQKNKLEILPLMFLFLIAFNLLFESMFERFWGIIFFTFFYSMFFVSKINE